MEKVGLVVETVPSVRVALTRLIGSYEKWGLGLMALKDWLGTLMVPFAGEPIRLFSDNPLQTPDTELRIETCLPVMGSVVPYRPFDVKEFPGGQDDHNRKFRPSFGLHCDLRAFLEGIIRAGYSFEGPARDMFIEARADMQPVSDWANALPREIMRQVCPFRTGRCDYGA